jgi:hypothetical protein
MKNYLVTWRSLGGSGTMSSDKEDEALAFYSKLALEIDAVTQEPLYEVGFYTLWYTNNDPNKKEDNGNQPRSKGNPTGV